MLADVIDAVVGADTHRDTHTLEITCAVPKLDTGCDQVVRWLG